MDYVGLVGLASFALVGVWSVVNPAGILGWAKQAHPAIDENDPAAQSIAKFIGAWFIILAAIIFIVTMLSHYRP